MSSQTTADGWTFQLTAPDGRCVRFDNWSVEHVEGVPGAVELRWADNVYELQLEAAPDAPADAVSIDAASLAAQLGALPEGVRVVVNAGRGIGLVKIGWVGVGDSGKDELIVAPGHVGPRRVAELPDVGRQIQGDVLGPQILMGGLGGGLYPRSPGHRVPAHLDGEDQDKAVIQVDCGTPRFRSAADMGVYIRGIKQRKSQQRLIHDTECPCL